MKTLVTYSSLTGNTKRVAEAILEVMPEGTAIYSVEEAPSPENYDLIIVGFWADRTNADKKAQKYMEQIKGKKVAIFGTLGAYPDSDHAKETMKNARELVKENEILGDFLCQGKVDPKLVARFENLPADHPHGMTPERKARLQEASKHPNEEDFIKAKKIFTEILKSI
ncbi:flavodoxin family protein [Alkaliphilus transvaalensis]|uniref:flavodoxin family protein n=1 Tax=Alkaliphilus transvaalensis TaxID=114628 RepID=UPI00047CBC25|nr:flavodoxin family protein [Alkaliphilus transvaalensis]